MMTDWSKLKVVDLKEECKARDISLTGLKLKQQFIDKLEEYEANNEEEKNENQLATNTEAKETPKQPNDIENGAVERQPEADGGLKHKLNDQSQNSNGVEDTILNDSIQPETNEPNTEDNLEDVKGTSTSIPMPASLEDIPQALSGKEEDEGDKKHVQAPHQSPQDDGIGNSDPDQSISKSTIEPTVSDPVIKKMESKQHTDHSTLQSPPDTSSETAADLKRRKRRSASPVPSSIEMSSKRAKANDGTPIVISTESSSLELNKNTKNTLKEAIEPIEPTATAQSDLKQSYTAESLPDEGQTALEVKNRDELPKNNMPEQFQSPADERDVPPSIHPATSSLYFRNFKRPLHIPTLKAHIASLAKSPTSNDESDPIKTFYLDSIRTHAFISFTSISAASRVRTSMHDTRFPNESMREPLFVDFIPDNVVQEWIEEETNGGTSGRGGNGKRYEVIYDESAEGIVARLQDVDLRQRSISEQKRNIPIPIDRLPDMPLDRSKIAPRDDQSRRIEHNRVSTSKETGFKALDELFSFTKAKPKLYFKEVPKDVSDERLGMIHNLRINHSEMGKSGDEGMKRYSFEMFKGQEEWVDKGPEFGFGRKGQDRLMGSRMKPGGFRGRRQGHDSWRSK